MINAPMLKSILIGAALLTTVSTVAAQTYPTRPVRFVVPYAPGGSTDTLARSIATVLADQLGQQVVVDNRTGANGDIGMTIVAKAPADGYTVVLGYIANIGIGPSLYEKMPYDPVKDFAPITQVAGASNIFVTHPSLPAKNFKEFIAYTKANPKKVSFATAGVASVGHLTGELLNDMAGIDMQHIPYKGDTPMTLDLVAGRVQVAFGTAVAFLPQVQAGKLNALAVTDARPSPVAPQLPTVAASGLPGFEVTAWLPDPLAVASLAILPLRLPLADGATGALFGLLVLASPDSQRFNNAMGTEFLERLAELCGAALSPLHRR